MANNKGKVRASDHRDRRHMRPRPQGAGAPPPGRGRGQGDQRASAKRNYERYMELARAAVSAGDPIEGENLYQHAEHYFRAMRELEGVQSDHGDRTS
jgi:hypothetical protein